jgi:hypothetical protein
VNVTFTKEDGTEKTWEKFRPGKMMTTEAEVVEKVTGMTFVAWGQALMEGSTLAGRALVWVLLKREDPTLRFRDVVYSVDSLLLDLDEEEREKLRDRLEHDDSLDDDERDQLRAALGESEIRALDFEPEPDGSGNDPAPPAPGSGTD